MSLTLVHDVSAYAGDRQRDASDPAVSAWVGASAGTGKTKVLADRVLRLLLSGVAPERICCITFTNAAAAEMETRVGAALSAWAVMPDDDLHRALKDLTGDYLDIDQRAAARRKFALVMDAPGKLKILTIHGFCQSLLRRFPIEAGLSPDFVLLAEGEAAVAAAEASAAVLDGLGGPEASAAVAHLGALVDEDQFARMVSSILGERGRLGRLLASEDGLKAACRAVRQSLGVALGLDRATRLAAACADTAFDASALRAAAQLLSRGGTSDARRAEQLAPFLAAPEAERVALYDDYACAFLTAAGEPCAKLTTKQTAAAEPVLRTEQARVLALKADLDAIACAERTEAWLAVARAILLRYEADKRRRGALDFDDLILRAHALLTAAEGATAWVLYKLDQGIDHLLLDEAQDTNPEQWAIVGAIADEFFAAGVEQRPRTLFTVGDAKQSIYGFQRADPQGLERMRRQLARWLPQERHRREVALTVSFRSTAPVLTTVDRLFTDAPHGVLGEGESLAHLVHRGGHPGLVELWPLPPEDETEPPPAWTPVIAPQPLGKPVKQVAERIARHIQALIGGGATVTAKGGAARPIRPGDVLVLVQTRNQVMEAVVRACKARGVPVAGVDRMVLTAQIAVQDMMALLAVLLQPADDLSLAALLRSPLVDLSEDELAELAIGRRGSLWPALVRGAEAGEARLAPARAWLGALLGRADYDGPHALLARVLAEPCPADPSGSGRRAFAARLGPEALDPLDELVTLALADGLRHAPSLEGFLARLRAAEPEIKRQAEPAEADGPGRVRVMTVHAAKGLEAPVVILADAARMPDPNKNLTLLWPAPTRSNAQPPPLWCPPKASRPAAVAGLHADHAASLGREHRRLLYVAMTRARDRLVIAGFGKPNPESWHTLAQNALEGLGAGWMEEADGPVLRYGDVRPTSTQLSPTQPSPAKPGEGSGSAPFPDASAGEGWGGGGSILDLPPYARTRPPAEPSPTRPLTPSAPHHPSPASRSPLDEDGMRFRRGLLVHRMLQSLPELPASQRQAAAARFLAARWPEAGEAERAALAAETLAVLAHPALAEAFGPGSRAEVPLAGRVGTRVLSGQVDRLLVTPARVLVLDYKTNRPPPRDPADVPPAYLEQMAAYRALLLGLYPDRPVEAVLVWTDGPLIMPLPPALLDGLA